MEQEDRKFISERISRLRLAKGNISSRAVSEAIGKNQNYINQIENLKTKPSLDGLFAICKFFEISIKEFFYKGNISPWYMKEIEKKLEHLGEPYAIKLLESLEELEELAMKKKV